MVSWNEYNNKKGEKLMDDKEWSDYLKYGKQGRPKAPLKARTASDLFERANQLNDPKQLLGPFQTGTWGIIAAPPGAGKSMLAMKLAWHMVTGHDLEHWKAPQRSHVLLIDAEMGPKELAGRMASFGNWPDDTYFGIHDTDLCDLSESAYFSLGDPDSQENLMYAGIGYDVIIIDNIEYTLDAIRPGEIYSPETWKQVFPLLSWAVMNDKLLILIDHTNAAGRVQGTLSKQRGARFILELEKLESDADMCFSTHFRKMRYQIDKSLKKDLIWRVNNDQWEIEQELSIKEKIGEMIIQNMSTPEMAEELGITNRAVNRIRRQLTGKC